MDAMDIRDEAAIKRYEVEKNKFKNYTFHKRASIPEELIIKLQVLLKRR